MQNSGDLSYILDWAPNRRSAVEEPMGYKFNSTEIPIWNTDIADDIIESIRRVDK
jgi:hypothetical protein